MRPVSFDGNSLYDSDYRGYMAKDAYPLPPIQPGLVNRLGRWPIVSSIGRPGRRMTLDILITGSPQSDLVTQLYQWFDPEDETPKKLVVEDDAGGNDRYIYVICDALIPDNDLKAVYHASLVVHGMCAGGKSPRRLIAGILRRWTDGHTYQ